MKPLTDAELQAQIDRDRRWSLAKAAQSAHRHKEVHRWTDTIPERARDHPAVISMLNHAHLGIPMNPDVYKEARRALAEHGYGVDHE